MKPSIALVYDRVNTKYGGAEHVLQALHELYPDAPLFTSVYDPEQADWAKMIDVRPSFLQSFPGARTHHRAYVAAMPLAFESHDLHTFDIVISITSAEAKGVLTKPNQLHLCYLLTPTRYLWSHRDEYTSHIAFDWLRRIVFRYLRWWDEAAAFRPDVYIPISNLVAERCHKYYHRDCAPVIYPPVSLPSETAGNQQQDFYLIISRFVPYKKIDVAIETFRENGKRLIIIGNGPDKSRLLKLIHQSPNSSNITLIHDATPEVVSSYYQQCKAFLAPAEEDFGITVLEAQSYGKPVIVFHKSGAAETVLDGETGILLKQQTTSALAKAIDLLEKTSWNQEKIRQHVQQYGTMQFKDRFQAAVQALWTSHLKKGSL